MDVHHELPLLVGRTQLIALGDGEVQGGGEGRELMAVFPQQDWAGSWP